MIVAAVRAEGVEPVSKGGRGHINPVKARAIAEGGKLGISARTIEKSLTRTKREVVAVSS
jgi:hypothetical protein